MNTYPRAADSEMGRLGARRPRPRHYGCRGKWSARVGPGGEQSRRLQRDAWEARPPSGAAVGRRRGKGRASTTCAQSKYSAILARCSSRPASRTGGLVARPFGGHAGARRRHQNLDFFFGMQAQSVGTAARWPFGAMGINWAQMKSAGVLVWRSALRADRSSSAATGSKPVGVMAAR